MGNVKSVPVLGEAATVVETVAKLTAGGVYASVGNKDKADKLYRGAGDALVEYSEKSLILGGSKFGEAFNEFTDCVPGIGHMKGIFHAAEGDTEKAWDCMNKATRSSTVIGTALMTGGAGFAGGLALNVAAGVAAGGTAGLSYDTAASIKKGEDVGCVKAIKEAANSDDPNKTVDVSLAFLGDSAGGAPGTSKFYEKESTRMIAYSTEFK